MRGGPAAPQYERPVGSPAGFVARRPMGRGAARPSTRFLCFFLRGCVRQSCFAAAAASCLRWGVALACSTHPLLLFLRLLYCQRPRARLPVCTQSAGAKVLPAHHSVCRHTRFFLPVSRRVRLSQGNRSRGKLESKRRGATDAIDATPSRHRPNSAHEEARLTYRTIILLL